MERGESRAEQHLERRTAGPEEMIREVRRQGGGAAPGECGYSPLRVRGGWMLTINSQGIQISIAGCVGEIVRDPNLMPFFFFCFSFFVFIWFVLTTYGDKDYLQR